MVWVLVCLLVALFGLGFLVLHAREVWRKGGRLLTEIEEAAARLEAAAGPPDGVAPHPDSPRPPPRGGPAPAGGDRDVRDT